MSHISSRVDIGQQSSSGFCGPLNDSMGFQADFWTLLAGLAVFLLGMHLLQHSLKNLAGRRFKLFLKRQTEHPLRAIGGGALVTGILQSSSVVNLMIFAFVSAGVISLQHALAVMLGNNLGTTVSSWLIVTLGFRIHLETISLPLTGIAGLLMMVTAAESRWRHISDFLFGFGFLFLGLGWMRSGVDQVVQQLDLSAFSRYPGIVFVLVGLVITALIQSSSAAVAIVLTALYGGVISLYAAAAIVLGSELGTTIKLLLASVNGPAVAKRVAAGNFLVNLGTVLIVFLFLRPVLEFITGMIHVSDPLLALVVFQTLINLAGIILFLPLLVPMARFLEQRFRAGDSGAHYLNQVRVTDGELAIVALKKETQHFLLHTIRFCQGMFGIKSGMPEESAFENKRIPEQYDFLKRMHGEIHSFYVRLAGQIETKEDTEQLDLLISSVRNSMYAAKSMKDAYADVLQLRNSSNESKYDVYLEMQQRVASFFRNVTAMLDPEAADNNKTMLSALYKDVVANYNKTLGQLYQQSIVSHLSQMEISTIINFNRELFTCLKSVVFALKGALLPPSEASYFDELPGFIR